MASEFYQVKRDGVVMCPRCLRKLSLEPESIHTCSPTPFVARLEDRISELEPLVGQMRILKAQCHEVQAESLDIRMANRDCIDHFNVLKSDFDRLVDAVERSGVSKTSQEIADVLDSFTR